MKREGGKDEELYSELGAQSDPTADDLSHGVKFHQCATHGRLLKNTLHLKGCEIRENIAPLLLLRAA